MGIYQRLKDLREDMSMNQAQVGKIIKTTGNYYGDYEKGKRDIPTGRMITLAKYYNVSMDYITGLTNDKGGLHKNSKEERYILSLYNSLSEKRKGKVELYLEQLVKQQKKENQTTIKGDRNISIGDVSQNTNISIINGDNNGK
ncbi:MAG: helix-turn-helix transcriptional regulator [Ruminococcus sp.]|nr:helix-turn-helix transcriptional regulator [Ruminococcus sp.]